MTKNARYSLLSLLSLSVLACPEPLNPCDLDRFACDEDLSTFELDPTCDLTGDLTVIAGDGEGQFETLSGNDFPKIHFGPQGGSHAFVGIRVENADLERYDRLKVAIEFLHAQTFPYDSCSGLGFEPVAGAENSKTCWRPFGDRELVLGHKQPIQTDTDGAVQEHGILVFLDWGLGEKQRLDITVSDPCGRTGVAVHVTNP
jgi:hypothetical protein